MGCWTARIVRALLLIGAAGCKGPPAWGALGQGLQERREDDVADVASFLVYKAAVSPPALLFLSETNGLGESKVRGIVKSLIAEQTDAFYALFKSKKNRSKKKLLALLEDSASVSRGKGFRKRDALFAKDKSRQAIGLHKRAVGMYAKKVGGLSDNEMLLLWKYADEFRGMKRASRAEIDASFKELIARVQKSLAEGVNVRKRLESGEREFNLKFKKVLLKITDAEMGSRRVEKARFNLAGAIVSPNLLLQMAEGIDDPDKEKFLKEVVRALFLPVLMLRDKLKDKKELDVKEGVLEFIRACIGLRKGHFLREKIDAAHQKRSEVICKFTRKARDREEVLKRIDEVQDENNFEMMRALEGVDPSFFSKFLIANNDLVKDYEALLISDRRNKEAKERVEKAVGIL